MKKQRRVQIRLLFEPRDAWIGLYWNMKELAWEKWIDLYICFVPFVPLKITIYLRR